MKDYPSIPDYRRGLADSYINLGANLGNQGTGRHPEVEEFFRQAQQVYQQLVAEFPSTFDYRRRLALVNDSRGLVLKHLQRYQEAEESFRQAIENIEPLARGANSRPDDRKMLCNARERLGLLLHEVGRDGEAEELLGDVIKCLGQLAAEFPAVPEYRGLLVSAHINLGAVLTQLQRLPEAEEVSRAALELAKKLAADSDPGNRLVLGRCYYNLGCVLGSKRDEQEAAYRAAIEVLEKLVAEYPAPEEYRLQCRSAYHNLAHVLKDSGHLEEARDCWIKEAAVVETLIKDYPGNPDRAQALEDVRKELAALDQANAPLKADPSPNSGSEPEMPKTEPQKEETKELPKSAPAPEPAKGEEQPK